MCMGKVSQCWHDWHLDQLIPAVGAVLCMVRCSVTSLASTYQMPVAPWPGTLGLHSTPAENHRCKDGRGHSCSGLMCKVRWPAKFHSRQVLAGWSIPSMCVAGGPPCSLKLIALPSWPLVSLIRIHTGCVLLVSQMLWQVGLHFPLPWHLLLPYIFASAAMNF